MENIFDNKIILIGGSGDQKYSILKNNKNIINTIGKLRLSQSVALIQRANVLISPDSGSAHLAVAVGTETITLFGPTDNIRWRPYGPKGKNMIIKEKIDCAPCGLLNRCKIKNKCMKDINVKEVIKGVNKIL